MSSHNCPFKLLQAPTNGGYNESDHWIWCGSATRGSDGHYHLFASRWSKAMAFNYNWLTNSCVVRAVAEHPAGPYTFAEEVLGIRGQEYWDGLATHNPSILQWNGQYYLYYSGTTYEGAIPTCGELSKEDPRRNQARLNQRIGLATAPSPEGPWTRMDSPVLEPCSSSWDSDILTNPTVVIHDNGHTFLYYKSIGPHGHMAYGLARAEHPSGPFTRVGSQPIFGGQADSPSYEDAFVWHQDQRYHMIFKDRSGRFCGEYRAGAYATSVDGINWLPQGKAYSKNIHWDNGENIVQGSVERPQLLIENGVPTHLFVAMADGPGGFAMPTTPGTLLSQFRTLATLANNKYTQTADI